MDKVCGLDVHKDSVFACSLDEKGEKNLGRTLRYTYFGLS